MSFLQLFAMGHGERPLAEVFSVMPRCAPLRLPNTKHLVGHSLSPLTAHTWRTLKQVAFALRGKLLRFLYNLLVWARPGLQKPRWFWGVLSSPE